MPMTCTCSTIGQVVYVFTSAERIAGAHCEARPMDGFPAYISAMCLWYAGDVASSRYLQSSLHRPVIARALGRQPAQVMQAVKNTLKVMHVILHIVTSRVLMLMQHGMAY